MLGNGQDARSIKKLNSGGTGSIFRNGQDARSTRQLNSCGVGILPAPQFLYNGLLALICD